MLQCHEVEKAREALTDRDDRGCKFPPYFAILHSAINHPRNF